MAKKKSPYMLDFSWSKSHADIINSKGFGKKLNKFIADTVKYYAEPFTPYSTKSYNGARLHMAELAYTKGYKDKGQIVYPKWYASSIYEGKLPNGNNIKNFNTSVHESAQKEWIEHAFSTYRREITGTVNLKRKQYSK